MFLWNVYITTRHGEKVTEEDPWGYGSSLEWATSPARRRGTTSTASRASAPSAPRSKRTTRRSRPGAASKGIEQTIPALSAAKK